MCGVLHRLLGWRREVKDMEKEPKPFTAREKEEANKKAGILSELEKAKINKDAKKEAGKNWSTKLPSER